MIGESVPWWIPIKAIVSFVCYNWLYCYSFLIHRTYATCYIFQLWTEQPTKSCFLSHLMCVNTNYDDLWTLCFCKSSLKKLQICYFLAVNRGIHSTGVKRMGGHGHGHDEPFYLHAKHMYNLDRMKNQGLKMTLGVFTAFSIGVGVPIWAVLFQQRKTASA